MNIEEQAFSFFVSLMCGCLGGFFYDIYRSFVYFYKIRKVLLVIGDIIFWVILTVVVFFILLTVNGGELRGVMLLGMGLGAWVYLRVFKNRVSRIVINILEAAGKAYHFLLHVVGWIWVGLTTPFIWLYTGVAWPFKTAGRFGTKFIKRLLPGGFKKRVRNAGNILSRIPVLKRIKK